MIHERALDPTRTFGERLRAWRAARAMSQLDLSLAAGVSARHVSFIETGRSTPSRAMVLRLAETLELPLRERNALLVAAGYAAAFRESPLQHADLTPVRRALERILGSHEPYPAFLLDAGWNILLANRAHRRLLSRLIPSESSLDQPVNVARLVLDPDRLRPRVKNWETVAHVLGHRIHRQSRHPALATETRRLFEELLGYPGVREAMLGVQPSPEHAVVIPLQIELDGTRLSWFSTIATLGTPQDVTLDELRIESLFPADEATERAVKAMAG